MEYHKLSNGLRVVLSQDHTAPDATVAACYGVDQITIVVGDKSKLASQLVPYGLTLQ